MSDRRAELIAKMRKKARQQTDGGFSALVLPSGVEILSKLQKKMNLDILPYRIAAKDNPDAKPGELWYERTYYSHRNVGPENQVIVCPKTWNKPCPICARYEKMRQDPEADEDMTKSLRHKVRQIFNVLDRDNRDKGIMILDMSTFCFGDLLAESILDSENDDNALFWDLKEGKTLELKFREETVKNITFMKCNNIEFRDRKPYREDVLDETVDLDSILPRLTEEEIKSMFESGEEAEPVEETPAPTRRRVPVEETDETPPERPNRRAPVVDDDNRDEGPSRDTDDEAPEPTRANRRSPVVDDDLPYGDEAPAKPAKGSKCPACEGSGKNSRGRVCVACGGDGTLPETSEEPAPAKPSRKSPVVEEEAPPARPNRRAPVVDEEEELPPRRRK